MDIHVFHSHGANTTSACILRVKYACLPAKSSLSSLPVRKSNTRAAVFMLILERETFSTGMSQALIRLCRLISYWLYASIGNLLSINGFYVHIHTGTTLYNYLHVVYVVMNNTLYSQQAF